ncbi:MAG: flagellar hook-associated protein FlgK [Clostridiales bacterium]|jgi:flagellar hook-associated protein 1 FlgK|nr:flagellar hook-associated protein FlgK [Clostridiales bacterium]
MGGFTSLATAVSGLKAAQVGLAVTGHNMSNSQIAGYSRQRIIQKDFMYQNIGVSASGALKRGLGTDWNAIEQIRNQFLDVSYRRQNTKLKFYDVKATVGMELESLLGELQGAYNFQSVINDMWDSLQELSKHPDGVETRDVFLATCTSFVTKSNEVYKGMFDYQHRLDEQIRDSVKEINGLIERIDELNKMIVSAEISGDNANDYRDERNLCLDTLSGHLHCDIQEDVNGAVNITAEGHQLLVQGSINKLGLRQCTPGYSFVEPVFTNEKDILPADTPPDEFESLFSYYENFNANNTNDNGSLKALMLARGASPAFYPGIDGVWKPRAYNDPPTLPGGATVLEQREYDNELKQMQTIYGDIGYPPPATPTAEQLDAYQDAYNAAMYNYNLQDWSIKYAMIPRTMMQLDAIVNKIVTSINDTFAPYIKDPNAAAYGEGNPDAPYDLNGNRSYTEIFTRVYQDRWTPPIADPDNPPAAGALSYNPEVPGDYYSQYSIGNLKLNPLLLDTEGGYNLMAFSASGDREDNTLLLDLLKRWTDPNDTEFAVEINGINYGIQEAYRKFVIGLGLETEEAIKYVDSQTLQVNEADNKRNSIMGVSMDEELTNMMKYQYAYQSSARILNVIDSMIDRVINGTGRVGL